MAKWFGKIGFAETYEAKPGVWKKTTVEREYFGDMTRITRKWETPSKVNADLNISNELSIVLDPYAYNHFHTIRYATFQGVRWKVSSVEVQYPRLILSLGGVYNEGED